jgi:seryl-tRNA synthetase
VRLNLKDFKAKLPLIRQNILNRKAQGYANADLVNHLYEEYRRARFEIDGLRKKRNEHAAALKNVLLIEDEGKKEKLVEQHHKVGKSFKNDLQQREKDLEDLEAQLIAEAMKLPNKTHPDSPVGSEANNRVVKVVGERRKTSGRGHLQIGEDFDLFDFQGASKITGNKFVFLKNEAALMELALINWATNQVVKRGFIPLTTPDIARTPVVEACGFQPRDDAG